ncbi:hypothetical protein [Flavobacterium stagni]|uniref:Uncharacterized protein n=1 Tax=Flavobacterium stagni TaxID=2506421 RepID=A0A4Q1K3C6_9FLAO|nr:hypothetical protein [Flavobacterium stagni]RXR20188.1 hypothetical protein EQG61_13135 [Flavobacterium stagni]
MKTNQFLTTLFLVLISLKAICQIETPTDIITNRNFEGSAPSNVDELRNTLNYYLDDIRELKLKQPKAIFNNKMLNTFFNNEINSFAVEMKDLSLDTNFSNIDTENKMITIGTNINFKNLFNVADKNLRKTNHVLSLSVSGKIDKNYSKVYSYSKTTNEYDFASDFGINIKYTYLFNGTVKFNPEINSRIVNYRSGELNTIVTRFIEDDIRNNNDDVIKKYYKYYQFIAETEIKEFEKSNFINSYSLCYLTFNSYIPLTNKIVNHKKESTLGNFDNSTFNNWKFDFSLNYFKNSIINKFLLNCRLNYSLFNNNNFIAENTTPVTFQNITVQNTSQQVINSSDFIFIGDYKTFVTQCFKFEFSSLFINKAIGLSAAFEKNIGQYDAKNWKIGIPVSLKDNTNKPKVNFEIQWKEVNSNHFIGVSIGYIFGKFLK